MTQALWAASGVTLGLTDPALNCMVKWLQAGESLDSTCIAGFVHTELCCLSGLDNDQAPIGRISSSIHAVYCSLLAVTLVSSR